MSFSLFSILFLLYQYREGGIKDSGIEIKSIRDVGAYIDTGIRIIHGVNPYLVEGSVWNGARWGTFGTIPLALISFLVPRSLQTTFYQALGFVGIYLFLNVVFTNLPKHKKSILFVLVIWTSAFREMLVTNQITGIVLGCSAIGIKYSMGNDSKNRFIVKLGGVVCLVISLDLKPHIAGLIILGTILFFRRWLILKALVATYLVLHILIDLRLQTITEIDWLKTLQELDSSASSNSLGDSLSFWPVLRRFLALNEFFNYISKSVLILLIILTVYSAIKHQNRVLLFLIFIVPSVSIYFHYYDAIAIISLALVVILKTPLNYFGFFVLNMLIISKEGTSLKNITLVLSISLFYCFFSSSRVGTFFVRAVNLGVGFTLWVLLQFVNRSSHSNDHELQALVVTEVLVLCAIMIVQKTWAPRSKLRLGSFLE